jgi:hypothetical protein
MLPPARHTLPPLFVQACALFVVAYFFAKSLTINRFNAFYLVLWIRAFDYIKGA